MFAVSSSDTGTRVDDIEVRLDKEHHGDTSPQGAASSYCFNDSPEQSGMDNQRVQTLQALEAFIQTQRNLLDRQRSDIERLQRLKVGFAQRPATILANLNEELDDDAFRLSEQTDCRLSLPKDMNWSVFDKSDSGPLRTFAQRKREEIIQRSRPSTTQCSELSELQRFVKISRRTIIDPILARFADMSSPEPESEEEIDPVDLLRQQEQQKIRELKKRQIRGCGLSLPLSSKAGSMGVFIRPDVEEESMNVDVTIDDEEELDPKPFVPPLELDSDTPPSSQAPPSPVSTSQVKGASSLLGSRVRRPSKKILGITQSFENGDDLANAIRPRKKVKLKLPPKPIISDDDDEDEDEDVFEGTLEEEPRKVKKTSNRSGKPKPETFKQAWSESEQNLLEQLLEKIPEGEKNRYKKISQAMGGRRTPRQVASRVQKYFEKLKKFGLTVEGGG